MSDSVHKSLLAVGPISGLDKLEPFLARAWFEVQREDSGQGGLSAYGEAEFDLLILASPLPDMALEEFLSSALGVLARTPILVLADAASDGVVESLAEADRVRSVPCEASREEIERAAAELLGVSSRRRTRVMVNLAVQIEGQMLRRLCQAENISESGMLVHTSLEVPVGQRLAFEISLPGEERGIRGKAVVARHTEPDKENLPGIGLRYLSFDTDGLKRLTDFLDHADA
jgi:hypothetical protein